MKKVNDFFIRFENFFQQRQEIICWISFALCAAGIFLSLRPFENKGIKEKIQREIKSINNIFCLIFSCNVRFNNDARAMD